MAARSVLGLYGTSRAPYGSFAGKVENTAVPDPTATPWRRMLDASDVRTMTDRADTRAMLDGSGIRRSRDGAQ